MQSRQLPLSGLAFCAAYYHVAVNPWEPNFADCLFPVLSNFQSACACYSIDEENHLSNNWFGREIEDPSRCRTMT